MCLYCSQKLVARSHKARERIDEQYPIGEAQKVSCILAGPHLRWPGLGIFQGGARKGKAYLGGSYIVVCVYWRHMPSARSRCGTRLPWTCPWRAADERASRGIWSSSGQAAMASPFSMAAVCEDSRQLKWCFLLFGLEEFYDPALCL